MYIVRTVGVALFLKSISILRSVISETVLLFKISFIVDGVKVPKVYLVILLLHKLETMRKKKIKINFNEGIKPVGPKC